MFSKKHLKARLVAACYGRVFAPMAPLIRGTSVNNPAKWRWGMVVNALGSLLPIEKALRAGVNTFRRSDADEANDTKLCEDDTNSLNAAIMTKAIKSQQWWSYSHMLHQVHGLGEEFRSWSESCYCHGWLRRQDEKAQPLREHLATVRRNTIGLTQSYIHSSKL